VSGGVVTASWRKRARERAVMSGTSVLVMLLT
jgi:hypothetical protein